MKTMKWAALVLVGGTLLQFGGCMSTAIDLALNAVSSQIVTGALSSLTTAA